MSFGERIRFNRIKNKMSQKELAELLIVTPQTVSKWENDLSEPGFQMITEMTKIFRISYDTLFTGETEVLFSGPIYSVFKDVRMGKYYDFFTVFLSFLSIAMIVTTVYTYILEELPWLFTLGFGLFSLFWLFLLFVISRWRVIYMDLPNNLIEIYHDKLVIVKEQITIYLNTIKWIRSNNYSLFSGLSIFENTGYLRIGTDHDQMIVVRDIYEIADLKKIVSKIEITKGEE